MLTKNGAAETRTDAAAERRTDAAGSILSSRTSRCGRVLYARLDPNDPVIVPKCLRLVLTYWFNKFFVCMIVEACTCYNLTPQDMEMGDVTFLLSLGLIGFRHQQCECYENSRRPPFKAIGGRIYTVDVILLFSHQDPAIQ
ncbi:hypothetical protein ZWY2020_007070 [Hordeum vulgare]|nr:hypothetical protein ZWY2020_007070 [Hordeum vulgare]